MTGCEVRQSEFSDLASLEFPAFDVLAQGRGCSVVTADDSMLMAFRPLECVTALQAVNS